MPSKKILTECKSCGALNNILIEKTLGIGKSNAVCGKCQAELKVESGVSEVTDGGLEKILSHSDIPVVVDFWAPWCGPCRAFASTFKKAAEESAGQQNFIKINTEDHQQMAGKLGIRSIPTVVVFNKGREVSRQSGALDLSQLQHWIKEIS